MWLTWAICDRAPFVIGRAASRTHAVSDGRCYATRRGLRFSEQSWPYDPGPPHAPKQDGGWGLCRDNVTGILVEGKGPFQSREEAEKFGPAWAQRLGAAFQDSEDPSVRPYDWGGAA
jgi:hypothetical protein